MLLTEKAKKTLLYRTHNPCDVLEKLFDNPGYPVVLVMLYCSKIRGITCPVNDSTLYAYLHLKLLNEILGVHSKTSNDACHAELNRLPLRGEVLNLVCTYWQHLWSCTNSLVSKIAEVTRP